MLDKDISGNLLPNIYIEKIDLKAINNFYKITFDLYILEDLINQEMNWNSLPKDILNKIYFNIYYSTNTTQEQIELLKKNLVIGTALNFSNFKKSIKLKEINSVEDAENIKVTSENTRETDFQYQKYNASINLTILPFIELINSLNIFITPFFRTSEEEIFGKLKHFSLISNNIIDPKEEKYYIKKDGLEIPYNGQVVFIENQPRDFETGNLELTSKLIDFKYFFDNRTFTLPVETIRPFQRPVEKNAAYASELFSLVKQNGPIFGLDNTFFLNMKNFYSKNNINYLPRQKLLIKISKKLNLSSNEYISSTISKDKFIPSIPSTKIPTIIDFFLNPIDIDENLNKSYVTVNFNDDRINSVNSNFIYEVIYNIDNSESYQSLLNIQSSILKFSYKLAQLKNSTLININIQDSIVDFEQIFQYLNLEYSTTNKSLINYLVNTLSIIHPTKNQINIQKLIDILDFLNIKFTQTIQNCKQKIDEIKYLIDGGSFNLKDYEIFSSYKDNLYTISYKAALHKLSYKLSDGTLYDLNTITKEQYQNFLESYKDVPKDFIDLIYSIYVNNKDNIPEIKLPVRATISLRPSLPVRNNNKKWTDETSNTSINSEKSNIDKDKEFIVNAIFGTASITEAYFKFLFFIYPVRTFLFSFKFDQELSNSTIYNQDNGLTIYGFAPFVNIMSKIPNYPLSDILNNVNKNCIEIFKKIKIVQG